MGASRVPERLLVGMQDDMGRAVHTVLTAEVITTKDLAAERGADGPRSAVPTSTLRDGPYGRAVPVAGAARAEPPVGVRLGRGGQRDRPRRPAAQAGGRGRDGTPRVRLRYGAMWPRRLTAFSAYEPSI